MLIDINLLPEKQKKNYTRLAVIILMVIVFILLSYLLLIKYNSAREQTEVYIDQLQEIKLQQATEEKKLKDYTSSNTIEELSSAINWTEQLPLPTVNLIRHLTSLLPENGYIQTFQYSDEGEVYVTVLFNRTREAAYYISYLKNSEFVEEVNILSLATTTPNVADMIEGETNGQTTKYIGQFEIVINRSSLKNSEQEGTANE